MGGQRRTTALVHCQRRQRRSRTLVRCRCKGKQSSGALGRLGAAGYHLNCCQGRATADGMGVKQRQREGWEWGNGSGIQPGDRQMLSLLHKR